MAETITAGLGGQTTRAARSAVSKMFLHLAAGDLGNAVCHHDTADRQSPTRCGGSRPSRDRRIGVPAPGGRFRLRDPIWHRAAKPVDPFQKARVLGLSVARRMVLLRGIRSLLSRIESLARALLSDLRCYRRRSVGSKNGVTEEFNAFGFGRVLSTGVMRYRVANVTPSGDIAKARVVLSRDGAFSWPMPRRFGE